MDAAYDVPEIHEHNKKLRHISIIDKKARRNKELKLQLKDELKACRYAAYKTAKAVRYNKRSP